MTVFLTLVVLIAAVVYTQWLRTRCGARYTDYGLHDHLGLLCSQKGSCRFAHGRRAHMVMTNRQPAYSNNCLLMHLTSETVTVVDLHSACDGTIYGTGVCLCVCHSWAPVSRHLACGEKENVQEGWE